MALAVEIPARFQSIAQWVEEQIGEPAGAVELKDQGFDSRTGWRTALILNNGVPVGQASG